MREMNPEIVAYIDEYQRGKSGIRPFWVAQAVCSKFNIKESEALSYVTAHIKKVLEEVKNGKT